MLKTKEDVVKLIQNDATMMHIITSASKLKLPDWWICAGFIRSKIWDTLHKFDERTVIEDIDVIYFDEGNIDEQVEKDLEDKLRDIHPNIPWSVKNQARMHVLNDVAPYTSSEDAISKFPETATALGVKLDKKNNLVLTAPCGIDDVLKLVVKPTPYFSKSKERLAIYENRLVRKEWKSTWTKITIHYP